MRTLMNKEQTPQEFAREHWREIFAISGTLAGAVILLLIRYHKKRRVGTVDQKQERELAGIEEDARKSERPLAPLIIDLMPDVTRLIPDAKVLSEQLSQGLPISTEEPSDPKSRRSWRKNKRGNPSEVMKAIGKVK